MSQRDWDDAHLINAAHDIHGDDPAVGYRFITDELPGRGITAGENRVARLCSQERNDLGRLTPIEFETINSVAHAA